jgi:putative ABC transport system permease protein
MGLKGRWFRRRPSDDEMREELEAHVAMRAEHDGVDEAAARRRLGNVLHTRESMRRVWIAQWWDALRQDAHFTWRSWRRRPGFALAAILVLGVGLGASTALFAALDRVLFRPLPYADPDRLVSVGFVLASLQAETMTDKPYVQMWDTPPAPFESVTATGASRDCDIGEAQPERVRCATVDDNFLRVLGVRVAEGRDFAPEEEVRGTPPVALISHRLWVRRYGADPRAIGRTLSLESTNAPVQRAAIVGVLPPDFEMPLEAADILLPLQLRPLQPGPFMSSITAFARLKPDMTAERAERMLASELPELKALMPAAEGVAWRARPLRDRWVGDAARVAWLLVGAVVTFLLIACVNVSNLMLARVAERQREFAVRAAVGAGKIRLTRLAFAESLLLSLAAGGVGLLVAFGLLRTFVAMAPAGIPGIAEASLDMRVFVVAGVLVVLTGMAIGLWPAISVFRAGGLQGLRSTNTSSPGAGPRVRFTLVTTQIALTLALVGGSALLLRSLWNIVSIPLGFDAERVVTMSASLSATRYPMPAHRSAFFEALLARALTTPGAASAALSSAPAPLGANPWPGDGSIVVEGRPALPEPRHDPIRFRQVTSQYFETLRIPLISGRTFADTDREGEAVVVLNESAARILFAGEPAVGRRIRGIAFHAPWHTVAGIATDIRNGEGVTQAPVPEAYVIAPRDRWPSVAPGSANAHLAVRTAASPADADAFLRQIAADLDPLLIVTIQTADEQVARLTERPRFTAWLLSAFGALALALAATGLYSVASYLVMQRRRDIGIRIAIGASPRDVARQVVGEAGRWIISGALVGGALGWMGTRALQSQLYQVETLDPWSWAGALLALALVLAMAVFRPVYRAAHVDPVAALRAD